MGNAKRREKIHAVHPPPGIATNKPQRDADRRLNHHSENADRQGDARAVKDGAQEVAALRVGAEEKARVAAFGPERWQVGVEHIEARQVEGVLRRDHRCSEGC